MPGGLIQLLPKFGQVPRIFSMKDGVVRDGLLDGRLAELYQYRRTLHVLLRVALEH